METGAEIYDPKPKENSAKKLGSYNREGEGRIRAFFKDPMKFLKKLAGYYDDENPDIVRQASILR